MSGGGDGRRQGRGGRSGGNGGVPENVAYQKAPTVVPPSIPSIESSYGSIAADGFESPPNTLTEPICDTVRWDLSQIANNLKLIIFPNSFQEDPDKTLQDWDL